MRAVIQKVSQSIVKIKGETFSHIDQGLLILLGIEYQDDINDISWLVKKISNLRIFSDNHGVMNLSINDINGDLMIVSQFTLHAKTKKGNRPSYINAASPKMAKPLYNSFVEFATDIINGEVKTGKFGEDMQIHLVNDGPVTIMIDTKNRE